eukprot:TRINITY_DN460_c0_g1_i2.p1 TRINITY_DN460_c0_g1~~TRINITY_DN460_c0_g1_i2.p1  ORF type:complete len:115 (-),score=16.89 TRINITY_DN460_c0_g1_i2:72-416(-)
MATVYDWNCKTVDVHPQEAGETDVVYSVHWIVTGISDELDPEGNAYQSTSIGTQIVPLDSESEFIPFEDLTNEIVVDWTKDAMGAEQVTSIEASIQQAIDLEINPTSVTMTIAD